MTRNKIAPLIIAACILAVMFAALFTAGAIYTAERDRAETAVLRSEVAAMKKELANLKGVVHDQAVTIQHLTHPATIQQRTIDMLLGKGEFAPKVGP